METISKQAKKLANLAGVKTKIRSSNSFVYVTFLSEPNQELVDSIRALETIEAHGDSLNDTRYYTGESVEFAFQYEIPADTMAFFEAIKNRFADHGHHFRQAVKNEMGARGQAVLDQVSFK